MRNNVSRQAREQRRAESRRTFSDARTEMRRSSFSRQAGEPRTVASISVSRLASSFSSALMSRAMDCCRRLFESLIARCFSATIISIICRLRQTRSFKNRGVHPEAGGFPASQSGSLCGPEPLIAADLRKRRPRPIRPGIWMKSI